MLHEDREVLLTAYALGELSDEESRQVEQDIQNDPEAARLVEEVRETAMFLEEGLGISDMDMSRESWPIAEPVAPVVPIAVQGWGTNPNNLAHRGVPRSERVLEVKSIWGTSVLDTLNLRKESSLNLGDAPGLSGFAAVLGTAGPYVDVPTWSLPSDSYPLAESISDKGAAYAINLHESFGGYIEYPDGRYVTLEDIRCSPASHAHDTMRNVTVYPLQAEETLYIQHGPVTLQIRYVRETPLEALPPVDRMNYSWLNFLIVAFVLHASLVSAFITQPKQQNDLLNETISQTMGRFVEVKLRAIGGASDTPDLISELVAKPTPSELPNDGPGRGEMPNHALDRTEPPNLSWNGRSAAKTLLADVGHEAPGLHAELDDALAQVKGRQTSSTDGSLGLGGLGSRGRLGASGGELQRVDIGSLGTKGKGGGNESYGETTGSKFKKSERAPEVLGGEVTAIGALDKDLIRAVVDDHRKQVRYCYERELQANPGLMGKVSVQWVISKTGAVSTAKVTETTLDNAAVESCVTRRIRGWKFPAPRGGGVVVVRYPFVFKTAG